MLDQGGLAHSWRVCAKWEDLQSLDSKRLDVFASGDQSQEMAQLRPVRNSVSHSCFVEVLELPMRFANLRAAVSNRANKT